MPGQAVEPASAPSADVARSDQPSGLGDNAAVCSRCVAAAAALDLAVRRDSAYLNWKYIEPPHVRYSIAVLRRDEQPHGYAVYRHLREPQGRVTQIVDFLADPDDERGLKTLLRWIDREARAEDSDKIRCYVQHARFRRVLRRSGYFLVKSQVQLSAKVNAVQVPEDFYDEPDGWHFTWGDGDLDH